MALAIRLLGPVELIRDGTLVAAGGPTQRAVLAMLALHADEPVAMADLVDGIWGESDGTTGGRRTIWPHISRLRTALRYPGLQPLLTVPGGYSLRSDALMIDARDFERLLGRGRRHLEDGEASTALASLEEALSLWRGPALMDLREFPFATSHATRYDELRVDAAEERTEASLALGLTREMISELRMLVAEHPYRERLHGQLMLALYRAGQPEAALDAYQSARRRLELDLGVEPGPELERLHELILRPREKQDGSASEGPGRIGTIPADRRREPPAGPRLPSAPELIGRSEQLHELERLTAHERLVTLTGVAGSGKTVLAVALARRIASRFPDGLAFVDLAAVRRPAQVLPTIVAALGLSPSSRSSATQLADHLAGRQMLVLVDNFEHVQSAATDLEDAVGATRGLVLVTSRSPLGLRVERLVEVPPLPVPASGSPASSLTRQPAVRLFVRAAAASGGSVGMAPDELAAAADICRVVDGLPLAIEIAAAQTRVQAVQELSEQIRDELPRLRSRARDVPARQRTLEAAVGWSIALLDAESRTQIYQLTEFAGSFDAGGAAAVCRLRRNQAIELLAVLLDASLLTRQPAIEGRARFRLPEPVRAVARGRAGTRILEIAADRHASFMQREVDRLCPQRTGIQRPADLAQLRLAHHDVMRALAHLATTQPDRCCAVLRQLDDYWQWTGREADARRIADELLEGRGLSDRAAAVALVISGSAAYIAGQQEETRRALDRARLLIRRAADPATSALVNQRVARLAIASGRLRRARDAAREAVSDARAAAQPKLLALCLAVSVVAESTASAADRLGAEALDIIRTEPMPYTEAFVLGAIGGRLEHRDPARSIGFARSALEICRRFRSPESVRTIAVAISLAALLLATGDIDEARALTLTSLHDADRHGHRAMVPVAMAQLGEVEASLGHVQRAMVLIAAAQADLARLRMVAAPEEDQRHVAGVLERLEAQLGQERATASRSRGEEMSYRDAIAFALSIEGPHRRRKRRRVVTGAGKNI